VNFAGSSTRRLALLVAIALGLWAARDYILDNPAANAPASRSKPAAPVASRPAANRAAVLPDDSVCTSIAEMPARKTMLSRLETDPFLAPPPPPMLVEPAKPLAVEVPKVVVAAPPPVPPPPPAPTLPYRFMGLFNEPNKPTVAFLSLGSSLLTAKAGDTLQGGYRLESISKRELIFVDAQRNLSYRMGIDGETQ
jgi:hypothetical protein